MKDKLLGRLEEPDSLVRKSRSFKKIKGSLRDKEDASSYGVDVDARSVPSVAPQSLEPYMLKVILLLMDMRSRRFELLQLEFDSKKATVANILAQIPVAVADATLRVLTYTSVCDYSGQQKDGGVLLSDFCDGDDILVAVPKDTPVEFVTKKARPILNDKKVVKMLESGGISAGKWSVKNSPTASLVNSGNQAEPKPAEPAEKNQHPETPVRRKSSIKPPDVVDTKPLEPSVISDSFMLKVILLLLDPETRRFELLQLEFDSNKAMVSDVLSQIPVAVTENLLRTQKYTGICDSTARERIGSSRLADFCKGNDVLVAIPEGTSVEKCAALARPIIQDGKVTSMLKSSGVDPNRWKESSTEALPVQPPPPLSPPPTAPPRAVKNEEEKKEDLPFLQEPVTPSNHPQDISLVSEKVDKTFVGSRKQFLYGLVLAIWIAVFSQLYHMMIAAPISKGHILRTGVTISKCGIYWNFPGCDNEFLEMNVDGTLNFYNSKKEIIWKMTGEKCKSANDDTCIGGLRMTEDGYLFIGEKPIYNVLTKDADVSLTPWPFADTPNGLRKKKLR